MIPLEPNLLEEGFMVHAAQRLLRGERLYRDIASFTGPFPFEFLAACFRLFGEEIAVARGTVVLLTGAACASVYGLASRAGAGPFAHVAAACVACSPILLFPLFSIFFYTTVAFHLSLIAAYAAVRGMRSVPWSTTAGIVVACTALSKQTVGAVLAAGLLAGVAAGAPPDKRIRQALAMAIGGLFVAGLTVACFGVRGDLGDLVWSLVVLPLSFGESFRSPFMNFWPLGEFSEAIRPHAALYLPRLYSLIGGSGFGDIGTPMVLLTQFLYGLPFVALAATVVRRALGPLPPAAWIQTAVLLALTANLFPRTDWGHLAYVLPPSAVQLFVLARGSSGPAGRLRLAPWAAFALVLVLGVGTVLAGRALHGSAGPPTFGPRVPQRPVSALFQHPSVPRVIRYLRERVRPDEAIFVARGEPLIYFATDTRNPTPFGGVFRGVRDKQESLILNALAEVRYVVMSEIDRPSAAYYRDELPAVQAHLERYFHIPGEFLGENISWLSVLERGRDRGPTALDLMGARTKARAWVRQRYGKMSPTSESPPKLGARQNRRPLPIVLGRWGGGVDFEIELPRNAVFQADVGLRLLAGMSALYEHPRRTRMAVSLGREGQFETLESRSVLYRSYEGRVWSPLEVDLSEYGGERVTLRLEAIPDAPLTLGTLAWWGSPRIALKPDAGDQ
jgi:hypothetical protein